MKRRPDKLYLLAALLLSCSLVACERSRTTDENETIILTEQQTNDRERDRDTTVVAKTGETTEEKLEELRSWMNEKADRTDTAIRSNWPATREKLRRINADLERNVDSLSTESKEEYRQLRDRYQRWEERQDRRQNQPLEESKLRTWREQLLREYKDISNIQPANLREAYLTFMGTVRTKRRNWTQDDWDYVDHVYSSLNARRGQVENNLSTADKLKIRTLQAEYLALEGAADTRSMINGVDEK
ncbi:hypothetical protein H7F15_06890 [Pontibacter sp. Tf4]|uniref:hypothetical protein n=1 Tax=Pontibacter sp. Tf4 TaxID=2761620 RepID=UPI00162783CF|nr:hypothetical protein [Pontibacter sp. Tf4]MBB6610758.1 hypothetical protein [Pontibacter sp. Tf4]